MKFNYPNGNRKSHMEQQGIYFWTATINSWHNLLHNDRYKDIIIDSWDYLNEKGKIDVFAFVIMPTHLHSIWRLNEPNGKETALGSFMKYTAHKFRQELLLEGSDPKLIPYKVRAGNKEHEFWQRDPLAVPLYTRKVALQKLNYIHNNPMQKHWRLAKHPCDYNYSSARYYEMGDKNFRFLKNLWEVI